MEIQLRKYKTVQMNDQENLHPGKEKNNILSTKRGGLSTRGVLGEIDGNVQIQANAIGKDGKGVFASIENSKKINSKNVVLKSDYSYVQSKIDTGLGKAIKARPPLRREESTAGHAARAMAKIKLTTLKKTTTTEANNQNEFKKPTRQALQKLSEEKKISNDDDQVTVEAVSLEKLKLTSNEKKSALPKDIEDIDAKDKNCPLLLSVYIKDIYNYLRSLEVKYPVKKNYLENQAVITGMMRATLIDWLVEVQQQFSLLLETLQVSIGIIDRYLQVTPNVQKNQLQLIGITAMFIASKYEEVYAPDVSDFVYITNNAYKKVEVYRCERDILSKLGFSLSRPIPLHFLRRFVKAAHGTSVNHHLAKYLIDLSLVDYSMAHHQPSELAAAALCLSLHLLSRKTVKELWTPTLVHYSKYDLEEILPIMKNMAHLVLKVEKSKHKAVYSKYMDSTFAKVSSLPQLKGPLIKDIAGVTS